MKTATPWRRALRVIATGGFAAAAGWAAVTPPPAAAQQAAVPPLPAADLYAGSPYLGELRNSLIYGEIWERPQLSKRDRSLITIAALQALTREDLAIHV
ncbi:MAG: carboxymuconolactone decarboxylase family protein, partial [Rhodospirillaceae bacterium]|nr:carboxymuconolactone decarboxylase family protein [Rhodospirillaceae bacterium]